MLQPALTPLADAVRSPYENLFGSASLLSHLTNAPQLRFKLDVNRGNKKSACVWIRTTRILLQSFGNETCGFGGLKLSNTTQALRDIIQATPTW